MTTRDPICPVCGMDADVFRVDNSKWYGDGWHSECRTCEFHCGPFVFEQDALAAWEAVCWTLAKDKLAPEVRHKADLPCNCLDHITPDCEYHKWLRAQK